MYIQNAVGLNSPNDSHDVLLIQALLNLNVSRFGGWALMVEDGIYGRTTQSYISEYQRLNLPVANQTGVIQPTGPEIADLRSTIQPGLTLTNLTVIMPLVKATAAKKFLIPLLNTMTAASINTPLRQMHFLAQLGHESGSLNYTEELASGDEYEGRADLGNTQTGDGPLFKGRGLIQITGRANYGVYGQDRNANYLTGARPKLLSTDPNIAADSAGWFWAKHNLNALADADDLVTITQRINGGQNGADDRARRLKLCKCILQSS